MKLETLRKCYKNKILKIASECQADNIRVFGSTARNDAKRNSDIDLLVHFKPGADLFDIGDFQYRIEDLLKRKVDVIPDNSKIHPLMRETIIKDIIPL